jgi:hypothetical protein
MTQMKQLTRTDIAKLFALTGFSALSVLAVAPAQAVVMTFESLAVNSAFFNNAGSTYTESGFTVVSQPPTFLAWGTLSTFYPGSTALFSNTSNSNIRLTQVGGGAFNLSSIDLTNALGDNVPVTVSFTGTRADSSTVAQSFTTDNVVRTLETFNFTNFTNLVRVDWAQGSVFHQFDNINVSAAATTAVPEPFTIIGTLVGGTAAFRMRKKLKLARK